MYAALADLYRRHPWLPLAAPLAVYLLAALLEEPLGYPVGYALKVALTVATFVVVWPALKQFPWRVSGLAFVVGVVGFGVWIGLCELAYWAFPKLGLAAWAEERPGFNPLVEFKEQPLLAWGFLALRLCGLIAVVPLAEELIWRGLVQRMVAAPNWTELPIGHWHFGAAAATVALATLIHNYVEYPAAIAFFSLVTWLVVRTKNLWDAVVAHGVTNALLGLYVLVMGNEAWRYL